MSPPSATSGAPGQKNGPSTVASVASIAPLVWPLARACASETTIIERPRTSERRMNSGRRSVEICPVSVRKRIPASHSSGVRSTSRANACRCFTSEVMISRRRGSLAFANAATTSSVSLSWLYSDMAISPSGALAQRLAVADAHLAVVVDDLAADDGQHRPEGLERLVGDAEVVAAEDDEIGELALLDRAELVLLLAEPAVFTRVQAHRLEARQRLPGVDDDTRAVLARRHVVEHQPRVERRDLRRVGTGADLDAAVDDRAVRRAAGGRRAGEIAEAVQREAAAERLQALDVLGR